MKVRRVTSSEGFGGINQSLAPLLRALHLAAEFCYFPDWIKKQSCTKIQDEHHNMAADGVASPQLSLSAALALSIQLYAVNVACASGQAARLSVKESVLLPHGSAWKKKNNQHLMLVLEH